MKSDFAWTTNPHWLHIYCGCLNFSSCIFAALWNLMFLFFVFFSLCLRYVRIVGTHNTVNKVFHLVAFECMFTNRPFTIENGLMGKKINWPAFYGLCAYWVVFLSGQNRSHILQVKNLPHVHVPIFLIDVIIWFCGSEQTDVFLCFLKKKASL